MIRKKNDSNNFKDHETERYVTIQMINVTSQVFHVVYKFMQDEIVEVLYPIMFASRWKSSIHIWWVNEPMAHLCGMCHV